jgi:hypothetical protein
MVYGAHEAHTQAVERSGEGGLYVSQVDAMIDQAGVDVRCYSCFTKRGEDSNANPIARQLRDRWP